MHKLTIKDLNLWKEIITSICSFFDREILVFETDCEKIIWLMKSDHINIREFYLGLPLKINEAPAQSINTGKFVIREEPENVYGISIKMCAIPICDFERAIGSLVIVTPSVPVKTADEFMEITIALRDDINEIKRAITRCSTAANTIKKREKVLSIELDEIYRLLEEINEVIGILKQVSDETKSAGLNLAIEVLLKDSGSYGLVNREIRRLSEKSKRNVKDITMLTEQIKGKLEGAKLNNQQIADIMDKQDESTKEIRSIVMEMEKISNQLEKITNSGQNFNKNEKIEKSDLKDGYSSI